MTGPVTPTDADPTVGTVSWWNEHDIRLGRRRQRPNGLTIERIVTAACNLIDDDGLEALTVRRLARQLSTASASLYRHVASRDEVLVLVVDHVLGEVELPPDHLAGRAEVEWLARELRRVLLAHPHLLPALAAWPLLGPNAMRGADRALTALLAAGHPPARAVPAYLALLDYVLGTVFFDTSFAGRRSRDADSILSGSPEHEGLDRPGPDEVFEFGLTTFLDGLDRGR